MLVEYATQNFADAFGDAFDGIPDAFDDFPGNGEGLFCHRQDCLSHFELGGLASLNVRVLAGRSVSMRVGKKEEDDIPWRPVGKRKYI